MYARFFGLKREPFSIAPDPRFLFMSERHREALAHLLYGLDGGGGFVLLTGEIGAGKTTVCRCFLEQIPKRCNVAYIFNPKLTVTELLKSVCDEFRIGYAHEGPGGATVKDYLDPLNEYLLKTHAVGQNNVLIIDEAQNLSAEVLEQLRLLTNLETNERKLLQIVLIGQPELRDMLARPELEQLAQRVIARFHLEALTPTETSQYIRHRLAVAGLKGPRPFEREAVARIHSLARGVPRRINLLCDRALLGAYSTGRARVDRKVVDKAAVEVFGKLPVVQRLAADRHRLAWLGSTVAAALAVSVVIGLSLHGDGERASSAAAASAPHALGPSSGPGSGPGSGPPSAPGSARGSAAGSARASASATGVATGSGAAPPAEWRPPAGVAIVTTVLPAAAAANADRTAPAPADAASASASASAAAAAPMPAAQPTRAVAEDDPFKLPVRSEQEAWRELAPLWGLPVDAAEPCPPPPGSELLCFKGTASLGLVRQLGRPGIVGLRSGDTAADKPGFAVLVGLTPQTATVRMQGLTHTVPLQALARVWRGEFATLWKPPAGYRDRLLDGSRGPAVDWVAAGLARLQGLPAPAARQTVDAALKARVHAFQFANELRPDGIAGPETLMLLNRATGVDEPRLQTEE